VGAVQAAGGVHFPLIQIHTFQHAKAEGGRSGSCTSSREGILVVLEAAARARICGRAAMAGQLACGQPMLSFFFILAAGAAGAALGPRRTRP